MSYVVNKDGAFKEVANLGWLLRHWDEVEAFEVLGGNTKCVHLESWYSNVRKNWTVAPMWCLPDEDQPMHSMDSVMVAYLKDNRVYVTRWASYSVMLDWVQRPKFRGLPIRWFSLQTKIP